MQPDRFTIKSQEALATAARLAQERANPQVVPAHLLSALLDGDGSGLARPAARAPGLAQALRRAPRRRAPPVAWCCRC